MHHFVTEMCTHAQISYAKGCIMGYCTNAAWDLWNGSIPGLHPANERRGYKVMPFPIGCVEHGSTWIQTVGVFLKPNYSNKKYDIIMRYVASYILLKYDILLKEPQGRKCD